MFALKGDGWEVILQEMVNYQLECEMIKVCLLTDTTPLPPLLAACGGFFRNITVGRIVSPGFPTNYSNNLTCHWLLEAPEGQKLHIHFEKVALAEDDDR